MVAGSRRRDAVALLGVLVLVAVSVWIVREIRTSDNPVNTAAVYATYLGVATLMVSLLAFLLPWWWKSYSATAVPASAVQVMAAADHFAQRMLDTWRREAKARGISTPAPVKVRWQWGPAEVTPPLAEVITVPVIGTGPRPLPEPNPAEPNSDPPGVVLEAGVVTRLHAEVYCRLPHGRLVLLGGPGAGKTGAMILLLLAALDHRHNVPEAQRVEVPVPVWLTLGGWDPTAQTLHEWVAATIDRDHSYLRAPEYGLDAPGELFSAGRVALFLDGLDEMAPSAQGKALARIDQEGAGLRIVLSCRPDEYRQALSEDRVHNTAVIEVQQVDPEAARAYLLHDQIGSQHDRWAQVGEYLIHHPDSVAAHALNNPLTLSLARATYQDQDPTPLTNPTEFPTVAALREHLIERSLITAYPDEDQRAHATRWLAWIAHHMGSERDLAWWHIPAWIPRWQLRLVGGLTSEVGKEPQAIFPRLPRPRELSKLLAGGLAGGLAFGLAGGLAFGLVDGLAFGFAGGLAGGLTALLDLWTVPLPRTATATPAARYWIDRRTSVAFGLVGGLVGGLAFGLVGGLMGGLAFGLAFGLAGGLAGGLTGGLEGGSMPKVSLTELALVTTGAGRVKFIRVLEDARHRQVLRQAGAVYQFRHAELQDHLAKTYRRHTHSRQICETSYQTDCPSNE